MEANYRCVYGVSRILWALQMSGKKRETFVFTGICVGDFVGVVRGAQWKRSAAKLSHGVKCRFSASGSSVKKSESKATVDFFLPCVVDFFLPPKKRVFFHCLLLSVYLSFPYSIVYLTFNSFVFHVAFCLRVCLSTFLLFKLKSTQLSILYIFTCLIIVENRRMIR